MPRNISGTYSLPAGNPVIGGTTIDASWANNTLNDVASELTGSLSRGGSGGMQASLRVVDGAVSTPGLAFNTETTSGLYRSAAGTLRLSVLGAYVMQWTATGIAVPGTLDVANLQLNTNTLSSTNTNGNIILAPNGTGDVNLDADTVRVGDSNANATITTNGTGDLILNTNAGTNSGSITIEDGTNGNIVLAPNGTGDVNLDADTVRIGDSGANATLTTNGAGDLILNTNAGTNSGFITIEDGANGNITVAPNGTGDVQLDADTIRVGDSGAAATITTNGAGNLTLSTNAGTNSGTIVINQGANGDIALTPNGTGEVDITKVNIDGGTIDGTAIGGASASTGAFTTLSASSTATFSGLTASQAVFTTSGKALTSNAITGTGNVVMSTSGTLTTPRVVTSINDTNGNELFGVTATGSAVNEFTVANAAQGAGPTLSATGSDTNININLTPKGTGVVSTTTVYATAIYAQTVASVSSFSWNTSTSSPAASSTNPYGGGAPVVTNIHRNMRRCLLADNGTVNYYLDESDSTLKADGSAAVLTGADGMVMVEIPAFYVKREVSGNIITWSVSDVPLSGFDLHPAFYKDGKDVKYRYYSAYDACVNTTGSTYQSGLNWDNNVGAGNGQAWDTATAKLASVSGIYPAVGITRANARAMAANRGTGWRQLDYTLLAAVQLLYLIEYQTFYSQSAIGNGNTSFTSWPSSSGNQGDSRASQAGLSNSTGNGTTSVNTAGGAVTDYMSYRGIENFFGSVWNWADGVIVNAAGSVTADSATWHFTNNSADFSDTVSTNMTLITSSGQTNFDYPDALASVNNFFISTSGGGSSTTYTTDYWYGSTSADRVVTVSGSAHDGANAGAFFVFAGNVASDRYRNIGARLAY